jgi:hypothetical protein
MKFTAGILVLSIQLLCFQDLQAQTANDRLVVRYTVAGLGSNTNKEAPDFQLRGHSFVLYHMSPSGFVASNTVRSVQKVLSGQFRKASVDSIVSILTALKPRKVFRSNHCIMSGVIYYLDLQINKRKWSFEMVNTLDYNAVKIIRIINRYLPKSEKLNADVKLIMDERKCR